MKEFEQAIASHAQAMEAGKVEEAQGAAFQALALAAEEAQRNPSPSLRLKLEAAECEGKRDWTGAEAAHRKVLVLEQEAGNPSAIAKAQMDLSKLLRLLGRLEEASEMAAAASASVRKGDMFIMQVIVLENEIACALDRGETQVALKAAAQAVQVIEPGRMFNLMRARALTHLARCLAAAGDAEGAESRLAEGWEFLQGSGVDRSLPGPISALANWWEVKSQVLEQQGNTEKAREALAESISYRRYRDDPYGNFAIARGLEKSAELSRRAGDLAHAERAMAEVNSLREDLRLPESS